MESLFQPNNIYVPYSDEEDVLYQFCDPNTSDEAFEESYTQFSRKKTSRVTHAKWRTNCDVYPHTWPQWAVILNPGQDNTLN